MIATNAICTDQWQCARDYRANESTWRMTPADMVLAWSGTTCPHCGGRFITAAEIVAALLAPDSLPDEVTR